MYTQAAKHKIDSLILNYFIQEGYQEAAISFARETGIDLNDQNAKVESSHGPDNFTLVKQLGSIGTVSDSQFSELIINHFQHDNQVSRMESSVAAPSSSSSSSQRAQPLSSGYSTINQRKQIKLLILKGNITEAISKISDYFPTILDTNNLLYFKLLRLNLIEMIRNHKLDSKITSEKEKVFLSDILTFVRENLINKVINSTKLLKELEITMSLLCFKFDPNVKNIEEQKDLPEELRNLFNLSLRNKCYGLVNKAILNLNPSILDSRPSNGDENNLNLIEFDLSKFTHQRGSDNDEELDLEDFEGDFEFTAPVSGSTGSNGTSNNSGSKTVDKDNEEELNKLHDLSLESKLEKIIKLWTITEGRLVEFRIIKEGRYTLNDE
ncbi:hypothetical protein CLIB1423_24S00298 [[Candida] railenensis]|uniref:CTLH domain-containing protein n=1 Tax=[Candida] railenensis TaxID=45579 RepID=A0A9P0W0R0_9ASCO|nr:hypothetical protein CLIB1423_24S00298 [[Candida] railenensis]